MVIALKFSYQLKTLKFREFNCNYAHPFKILMNWVENNVINFLLKNISSYKTDSYLACLHDQNKSGFFRGPAFFPPIRAI